MICSHSYKWLAIDAFKVWDEVEFSQVLPRQNGKAHPLWTCLCIQGHCRAEIRKAIPQTDVTELE